MEKNGAVLTSWKDRKVHTEMQKTHKAARASIAQRLIPIIPVTGSHNVPISKKTSNENAESSLFYSKLIKANYLTRSGIYITTYHDTIRNPITYIIVLICNIFLIVLDQQANLMSLRCVFDCHSD